MSEVQQTGKPGRYNRSTGGLIGSMIVLVLVVLGIVVFRGAFRDTPEYDPEPVEYLDLVASIQQTGIMPAYPPTLPDGWFVKDARFEPTDRPVFSLVSRDFPTYSPDECPLCRKGVPLNEEFVRRRTHRKASSVQEPRAS